LKLQASILIFLGSSLIFLIQPTIAKLLLPSLGGSPIVWNYCLFFFQAVLFLGYLYAHLLSEYFNYRRQRIIHTILLLSGLIFSLTIQPYENDTLLQNHILIILIQKIGLPYFLLCTGSVLIQKWYSEITTETSSQVYHLYFISNLASFMILLSFPVLIEVYLPSKLIISTWYLLFTLWAVGNIIYLLFIHRSRQKSHLSSEEESKQNDIPKKLIPNKRSAILWFLLSFTSTGLLFSVTNHITTNIAAVPFLWILPLSLYLISFMIVFDKRLTKLTAFLPNLYIPGMIIILVLLLVHSIHAFWWSFHIFGFFLIASALHAKISMNKPHKNYLSIFYLIISFGSTVSGFIITFIAPNLFNHVIEFPVLLVFGGFLMGVRFFPKTKFKLKLSHLSILIQAICISVATIIIIMIFNSLDIYQERIRYMCTVILPISISLINIKNLKVLSLLCFFIWTSHFLCNQTSNTILYQQRNHFGISRICQNTFIDDENQTSIVNDYYHGSINHGGQLVNQKSMLPLKNSFPIYYFHQKGPFGELMMSLNKTYYQNIAVLGLGSGNIAAYGSKDQKYTFFEINPQIIKIAQNDKYFSYLKNATERGTTIKIIEGDARIKIKSMINEKFDLIIMDAFSGDSIPVHLVTKEALQLYLKRSSENAIIVFHISNIYINLKPVLTSLADNLNLNILGKSNFKNKKEMWNTSSSWIIISKKTIISKNIFAKLKSKGWSKPTINKDIEFWTDQYSNLFKSLNWK